MEVARPAMAIRDSIPRKLTYEDYLRFPDDGLRHELIDGEHFESPAPTEKHQLVSWNMAYFLADDLRRNRLGQAFTAPYDVLFAQHDVVQPDLLYISNERSGIRTGKNVQGAPDLVIEILSESTRWRDEDVKFRLYERSGVKEYWILDPDLATVEVFRLRGQSLHLEVELSAAAADMLETPLLPGLRIPLEEVFRG
jgi:Uma2 family endonuclease